MATLLPGRTPAGLEISEGVRRDFLNQLTAEQLPSIALEYAILEEGLRTGSGLPAQSFLDLQHGTVALPHVKVFVSDDRRFTGMVNRVAPELPFELARMITRQEFDREFLGDLCDAS